MADLSRKTASVYINHQAAEDALVTLQKQADVLQQKIKAGEAAGKSMVNEIKKLNGVTNDIKNVQTQIDKGLRPSFNQLQTTVSKLRNELKRMSEDAPGYAEKFKAFNKASKELDRMSNSINGIKKEGGGLKGIFAEILPAIGVGAAVTAIGSFFNKAKEEIFSSIEAAEKLTNSLENAGKIDAIERLTASAEEFANTFKALDNDDIIEQIFVKLINYGKISENQIKQLTPVIIDYARKEKISLDEATAVMIDGLNGRGKALKRYGVDIKEAGTVTERLGILTEQLGNKIKGTEANFEAGPQGFFAKLKQSVNDIAEGFGRVITNMLGFERASFNNAVAAKKEAESAQILISEYETLSAKTNLTAQEKNHLKVIESDLVGILGDSILQINKQTGAYELNLKAAKDLVKGKLLLANDEAAKTAAKYIKQQDDNGDAIKKLKFAQESLTAAEKEAGINYNDLSAKKFGRNLSAAEERVRKAYGNLKKLQHDFNIGLENSVSLEKDLNELGFKASDVDNLLKPSDPNKPINPSGTGSNDNKDADAAAKKAEEARKKAAAELKKLNEEFAALQKKISGEFDNATLEKFTLDIKQIDTEASEQLEKLKYFLDKKIINQAEYNEQSLRLEEIRAKKVNDRVTQEVKEQEKLNQQKLQSLAGNNVNAGIIAANQKRVSDLELQLQSATGLKRLNLQLKLLDAQRLQELYNTDLTEKQKAEIQKKYDDKRKATMLASFADAAGKVLEGAQVALDIANSFNAVKNAKDDAKISDIEGKANAEIAANKRLLDQKLISQEEYDRRTKKIEEKSRKETAKLKQDEFKRNQKAEIIQAEISGAQAILNALKTQPFWLGLVLAGVAAIKTTNQIRAIKAQPTPTFARGGVLDGPSHSAGGMPIINPHTGRKVAEIEGGEPILSRRTYANNRAIVDALLQSSMYGGGRAIAPHYQSRPFTGMNFAAVNNTLTTTRKYERGGVFNADSGSAMGNPDLVNVLAQLSNQLAQPTKNYVLYSDVNAAAELDTKVKNETTFKRGS